MHLQEKIIPASPMLQSRWTAFRVALSEAARRHTGKDTFAISPFYAHELPGADAELNDALCRIKAAQVGGQFWQGPNGQLGLRLTWSDRQPVKAA